MKKLLSALFVALFVAVAAPVQADEPVVVNDNAAVDQTQTGQDQGATAVKKPKNKKKGKKHRKSRKGRKGKKKSHKPKAEKKAEGPTEDPSAFSGDGAAK